MPKLLLTLAIFLITFNSFAAFPVAQHEESTAAVSTQQGYNSRVEAIERMSIRDYEKLSGKKLNFIQKLVFKIERKHLLRQYKTAEAETSGFNIGGFALGFFFLPIGVLLAYLFSQDSNFRKWTWIGFGVAAVILSLFALVLSALVPIGG